VTPSPELLAAKENFYADREGHSDFNDDTFFVGAAMIRVVKSQRDRVDIHDVALTVKANDGTHADIVAIFPDTTLEYVVLKDEDGNYIASEKKAETEDNKPYRLEKMGDNEILFT